MSILTPTIVPFKTVDANEYFYIEYTGDPSSTTDNRFFYWRYVVKNLDTNTTIEGSSTIENYLNPLYADDTRTIPVGVWMAVTKNYYFCFPKNYVYNNQIVFENGYRYSIEIDFGVTSSAEVITTPYPFSCYANFTVALETYQYNDGNDIAVNHDDVLIPYDITVVKSLCKLKFSYTQEDNEQLKYYQFSLYNNEGVLLGRSKKTYGIPDGGIIYGIENYNNLQNYVLKLYCVTETDRSSTTTVNIYTNYTQNNIYADISFLVDTQTAENNVSVSVVQLNGEGENYFFADTNSENLLPYPFYEASHIDNGIQWIDNKDGTIVANGTASSDEKSIYYLSRSLVLPAGKYMIMGCPNGGASDKYSFRVSNENEPTTVYAYDYGKGAEFELTETTTLRVYLRIYQSCTAKNLTFIPTIYSINTNTDNQCVLIPDGGYVTFKDEYQVITNNFLCRMWLKNLRKNTPILTINTSDNSGRVEVFFDGMNFIAKKYSCDLVAPYITCIKNTDETDIVSELSMDTNVYFAIGYYNGRIEMYARVIS